MGNALPLYHTCVIKQIESEEPGSSYIIRSNKTNDLVSSLPEDVVTLYDNWKQSVNKFGSHPCVGFRKGEGPYIFLKYSEVNERIKNFGSGLLHLGFKNKDCIGIYSINRLEWFITEHANNMFSMTLVPLYDTLGLESVEYIINQSELRLIICSSDKLKLLLPSIEKYPTIKTIIYFDSIENEIKEKFANKQVKVFSFSEVETLGAQNPQAPIPPDGEDIATICYTSGTTGNPKGALLSHKNYIACAAGIIFHGLTLSSNDVYLSYLPLAHVYERICQIVLLYFGASIGFYNGDILKLFDDASLLRPTLFSSVPRLFNRLYDKVMGTINQAGGFKKMLFDTAYAAKLEKLKINQYTSMVWDTLVFRSIAARLGGRVRLMTSGSAPISGEVLNFVRICFSCPVLEGYGQTECSGIASLTSATDTSLGHVGSPLCCNEIKLVDVPEMNYLSTDKPFPRGEICFRGPNIFKGYFKEPEKTAETLEKDGWLHSGDIGLFDEEGNLKIIDRKKNIFKLAQGEYIAPEKIENIYCRSKFVSQSFIYGESLKSQLIAIIVPDEECVKNWAKENNIEGDFPTLCKNEKLKKDILQDLNKLGKEAQLRGFEFAKDIYVSSQPFTIDNDLLTPTFKLKRAQAKRFYQTQIDELYSRLE